MPNQAPSDKPRFVIQGNLIAAYPPSTAPERKPTNRKAIGLIVAAVVVLAFGIVAECTLRSKRQRQATILSPLASKSSPSTATPNPLSPASRSAQPKSEPNPRPTEYIVKSGDTLGRIAHRNGCSLRELAKANGFPMSNLPILKIGQRLLIPRTR